MLHTFEGKVAFIDEPRGGTTNAGKTWKSVDIVVSAIEKTATGAEYESKMVVSAYDQLCDIATLQLVVGSPVKVQYTISAFETRKGWMNRIKAYTIDSLAITPGRLTKEEQARQLEVSTPHAPTPARPSAVKAAPATAPATEQECEDDLPF